MASVPVELVLKGGGQVEASLGRVEASIDRVEKGVSQKIAGAFSKVAKGGALAATAAVVGFGKAALESAVEIRNLSKISGASTDALQRLGRIAKQSGGDADDVADAFREMQLRLAEVAELGTGPAHDALKIIGVSLADLEGMSPDQTFDTLRDAISQVEDPALQLFAAEELLGGSAERLNAIVSQSPEAFDKATAAIGDNTVLSESQIETLARMREQWTQLSARIQVAIATALEKVLPVLKSIAGFIKRNWQPILAGAAVAVGALSAALVHAAVVAIPPLILKVKALTAALLANPIGLVVAALAALAVGLTLAWQKSERFRTVVTGAFRVVATVVGKVVSTMLDSLAGLLDGIADIADKFTWLPGAVGDAVEEVRDAIGGAGDTLREWGDNVEAKLDAVAGAFEDFADRGEEAVDRVSARVSRGLGKVRDEMETTTAATFRFAAEGVRAYADMVNRQDALDRQRERSTQSWLRTQKTSLADALTAFARYTESMAGTQAQRIKTAYDLLTSASRSSAKAVTASTAKKLSESDRLARGLVVTMRNACGAVTGFKQCVDGVVVEFDENMDRILSDADKLASGIAVPITNACGTVTGFKQCVDGMVVEFDENMQRVEGAADRMASGVSAAVSRTARIWEDLSITFEGGATPADITNAQLRRVAAMVTSPRKTASEVTALDIAKRNRLGAISHRRVEFKLQDLVDRGLEDSVAANALRSRLEASSKLFKNFEKRYTTNRPENFDDLPALARGGIVTRPTLAMIGEAGPEAVVPLDRAGGDLHVTIELDGSRLGEAIVRNVNEASRRGELLTVGRFDD